MSDETLTLAEVERLRVDLASAELGEASLKSMLASVVNDLHAALDETDAVRASLEATTKALREAESWLTEGEGSSECHYALGIIRAALAAEAER